jgi:hypothetical protein
MSRLKQYGGRLELRDNRVRYSVPAGNQEAARLLMVLRLHRDEVMKLLVRQQVDVTRESELPLGDPYAELLNAALCRINAPDYALGMVAWIATVRPDLYAQLTSQIPEEIHRLWSERGPLARFEDALARMVSLHRLCCELYRNRVSANCDPERLPGGQSRCCICGDIFGSYSGWRAHVARGRCVKKLNDGHHEKGPAEY